MVDHYCRLVISTNSTIALGYWSTAWSRFYCTLSSVLVEMDVLCYVIHISVGWFLAQEIIWAEDPDTQFTKKVLVPLIFISNLCSKLDFSSQNKIKEIYMIEFKRYDHRPVSLLGLGIFHLRRDPSTSEERAVRVVHTGHILVSYSFGPNSTNIFFSFSFAFSIFVLSLEPFFIKI